MDPFEQLMRHTVSLLSYKDWELVLEKDGIGLWFLQIRVNGTDGATKEPIWSGRKWRLSMHMVRGEIVQTALRAVLDAEEHEAREQFLYRGRAIFGPHMSVDKLWALVGSDDGTERREDS